jgi:hypothetical protein
LANVQVFGTQHGAKEAFSDLFAGVEPLCEREARAASGGGGSGSRPVEGLQVPAKTHHHRSLFGCLVSVYVCPEPGLVK